MDRQKQEHLARVAAMLAFKQPAPTAHGVAELRSELRAWLLAVSELNGSAIPAIEHWKPIIRERLNSVNNQPSPED